MKTKTLPQLNWLTTIALLLALPTAYFILIALLKYGLGIDGPFDSAQPFLEKLGIKESLGWNINLLILFGPVIALFISVFQVLSVEWHFTKDQFQFNVTIQRKGFPIFVALLSILLLGILFVYFLGENYQHP